MHTQLENLFVQSGYHTEGETVYDFKKRETIMADKLLEIERENQMLKKQLRYLEYLNINPLTIWLF